MRHRLCTMEFLRSLHLCLQLFSQLDGSRPRQQRQEGVVVCTRRNLGLQRELSKATSKHSTRLQGGPANVKLHYDPDSIDGHKWRIVEKLWQEFFSDPSQWWDHRLEKANAKYPDFKHKKKQAALWLGSLWNPPWVGPELAAMAPGTVQVSIFSWNTRLIRSVEAGEYEKTLKLFQQMQQEGMIPNRFTFVPVLNACTNLQALEEGRHIHVQIMQSCCESDVYVGTSLVDMYAKCGSIEDAQRVFYRMPTRDVAAWSAMILAHVKSGQGQKALDLYQQMQKEGVKSDPITFVGVLNACASLQALEEGRHVHGQMIKSGCELNVFVGNSLIDMYTKCGCIEDARRVFDRMPTRDVVAWNAMILGHVKCGQGQKAMDLFQQMQEEGLKPSSVTFVGMLNACASVAAIEEGRSVHEQIIQSGCNLDVFIGSSLINMYANCGSIVDSQRVFNEMPAHNLISMNSMLGGYAMHGEGEEALGHFEWMCQEGAEIFLYPRLCLVLAEFMVMWRWESKLQNEFLSWTLEILQAMCCYETSMLLLASGISEPMFNNRG
ncbi:hypothetical protein BDL97_16G041200 [Sphagnum fallax]|nr:hypothetical protein BDL97_16G041200 [Sphagnum fallax]